MNSGQPLSFDRGKRKGTGPGVEPEEAAVVEEAPVATEPVAEPEGRLRRFWRRGTGEPTEEGGNDDE